MASGKTTVGTLLAGLTGKELVDTDQIIEESEGTSIAEMFEKKGEAYFRDLERKAIMRVALREDLIIAIGGGAVMDWRNVQDLKKRGIVYLLDVEPDEVVRRVGAGGERPLLREGEKEIGELLRSRERAYMEAADVVLETTGRSPREIALEISKDFEARAPRRNEGAP